MSEYDYLNARVRSMASRLIPAELIDQINRAEGEDLFVDLLMNSAYAQSFSEVLAASRESDALESALRRDLHSCLEKIREYSGPGARKIIDIQLGRWDTENVIAALRGKRRSASSEDIARAFFPAGAFHPAQLEALADEDSVSDVVDVLATWGYRAAPLIRECLRNGAGDSSWALMEDLLYRDYYASAFAVLDRTDPNEALLRGHLALQVDLTNILALLKRADKRSRGGVLPPFDPLPDGSLRPYILRESAEAPDVERALELLELTTFSSAVERGILSYGRDKRIASLERFLEAVVIDAGARLYRGDPLSAGIPLGYIWKKVREFQNLRILLRGKRYRMPANTIKEALILA